jgi:hypothetical protein
MWDLQFLILVGAKVIAVCSILHTTLPPWERLQKHPKTQQAYKGIIYIIGWVAVAQRSRVWQEISTMDGTQISRVNLPEPAPGPVPLQAPTQKMWQDIRAAVPIPVTVTVLEPQTTKENTMKKFLAGLENFFKKAGVWVSTEFEALFGSAAAKAFGASALATLESALGSIAVTAVAQAQATQGTSGEKFQTAFDNVIAEAKAQGIEAKTSIVNMLIELAVQKEAGSFGAPATIAPAVVVTTGRESQGLTSGVPGSTPGKLSTSL